MVVCIHVVTILLIQLVSYVRVCVLLVLTEISSTALTGTSILQVTATDGDSSQDFRAVNPSPCYYATLIHIYGTLL